MEIKPGTTAWTEITVSNAYKECEALNAATSTLGTTTLGAHLSTDADWSAMGMFSASQYGGATINYGIEFPDKSARTTNGNKSGIFITTRNNYSTGINCAKRDEVTNEAYHNTEYLFNADGTLKPYMKQWSSDRLSNNVVWFTDKSKGGTYAWFGGNVYWGNNTAYPCVIIDGLFRFSMGSGTGYASYGNGNKNKYVTFRPVIWN